MNEENLWEEFNPKEEEHESGYVDVANVSVGAHLIIRDADTHELLVNARG